MKIGTKVLCCSAVLAIVLLGGCAPVSWEKIGYLTPASDVILQKDSKIRVAASSNNATVLAIVKELRAEFTRMKQFKIDDKTPDYLIVISGGEQQFRKDDRDAVRYNDSIEKRSKYEKNGGHDYLEKKENFSSSTASMRVSVAVYKVNDLTPMHYFDLGMYNADWKDGKIKQESEYVRDFTKRAVGRLKESFMTLKLNVLTAIPFNADENMARELRNGNPRKVAEFAEAAIPQPFEEFIADIDAGKYDGETQSKEMERKLSNYYLLAVSQETDNFSPDNLRRLHEQHLTILTRTGSKGLAAACPNSLARIEHKLNLVQAAKGQKK